MGTVDDMATAAEERDRERALKVRRPEGPAPVGVCLNCGEPLPEGQRWCDAECRDDWSAREGRAR